MCCTSKQVIRRKWTVTYHGQYFTINSRISECDHKCETRNAEPEIGTDGSGHTRQNPRVDGYGSAFGPLGVWGSGFWTVLEPNRPIFAVQTRTAGGLPRPVGNTMWEWILQECYCACPCHRAKSRSVRKTTNMFKSGWKLFSMAADVEWTIH